MRVPSVSLLSSLAEVPDPRSRHGRRHPLAALLAPACCAILCGCRGYAAIAQWGRDQPIAFMHRPGYRRTPPCFGAFRGLFARLDAAALEAALARWVTTSSAPRLRAVAIDGRSARGNGSALAVAVHLLAALDQGTGCVLAQARIGPETNEHKAALGLLAGLVLDGVGPGPGDRRGLRTGRFPPTPSVADGSDAATTLDKHGGRVERRRLECTTMTAREIGR